MTYKVRGIILKSQDWQDYNRLYTVYTKERGKLLLIARGVKKIKSKQAGKLKPMTILELMAANGKKIDTLATADIVKDFPNLSKNLLALGLASFCVELVDSLTKEGAKDERVYQLLSDALNLLDKNVEADPVQLKAFVWVFALRLVDWLGYGPDFYRCVTCQEKVASPYNIVPAKGGLVCDKHAAQEKCVSVTESAMDLLRKVAEIDLADFFKMKIEPEAFKDLPQYIRHLISAHLEKELKSEKFLEKI